MRVFLVQTVIFTEAFRTGTARSVRVCRAGFKVRGAVVHSLSRSAGMMLMGLLLKLLLLLHMILQQLLLALHVSLAGQHGAHETRTDLVLHARGGRLRNDVRFASPASLSVFTVIDLSEGEFPADVVLVFLVREAWDRVILPVELTRLDARLEPGEHLDVHLKFTAKSDK